MPDQWIYPVSSMRFLLYNLQHVKKVRKYQFKQRAKCRHVQNRLVVRRCQ